MRIVLALSVLAIVAGCGSDSSTITSASVSGTYTMQSINGNGLPFTLSSKSPPQTVTSGTLTISQNGSWSGGKNVTTTVNGQTTAMTLPDAGTVTVNGSALIFTSNKDGSIFPGSFAGNSLTIMPDIYVYVFTKQP